MPRRSRFATHLLTRTLTVVCLMTVGSLAHAQSEPVPDYVVEAFGIPPHIPTGPLSPELESAIQVALVDGLQGSSWGQAQHDALLTISRSGDPRVAWLLSDLLRFTRNDLSVSLALTASALLGKDLADDRPWSGITDHLIAWDVPAPPNYLATKRAIFTGIIPGWEQIFVDGAIDWRHVSWGGVKIDARAADATDEACNCIPAADDPEVTTAAEAEWLADSDVVFGVAVGDEVRAYPRRIMEVREMVNDTLGGRRLGLPYCTLCGSMQAYYTDDLPDGVEPLTLRTSGLLIRSNKVMYDLNTNSIFDTFLGTAVTGPLHDQGVQLTWASVVTTTWGEWKRDHPDTTVLKERYALGRDPDFRNGRDANGPIFPIGDVDPRLPVQADIVGVVTASGVPVAFPKTEVLRLLQRNRRVVYENVHLMLDGGGVRAVDEDGEDLGSHEAFWFAWSQFHPDTKVWTRSRRR